MGKMTKEQIKTETAESHMFTLMVARMKIKVRVICGLEEINFLIWEMAAKLITISVVYFDNIKVKICMCTVIMP